MKITPSYVAEYKHIDTAAWHDAEWHAFMKTPEADAVSFGIWDARVNGRVGDNKYIAEVATTYAAALEE